MTVDPALQAAIRVALATLTDEERQELIAQYIKPAPPASQPAASGDFSIGGKLWPGISKLMEEAGEVLQVCGKLVGSRGVVEHWDGSNLRTALEEELADLLAAISFVTEKNKLDVATMRVRMQLKLDRFEKWHARSAGAVEQQRCDVCDGLVDMDAGCLRCLRSRDSDGFNPK